MTLLISKLQQKRAASSPLPPLKHEKGVLVGSIYIVQHLGIFSRILKHVKQETTSSIHQVTYA